MGNYCCFNCPSEDRSEKSLDSACPNCGRAYGFPLFTPPLTIGEFEIEKTLGRGFYAVTYVGHTKGTFIERRSVLKVSPKSFYATFHKDFSSECALHQRAAKDAEHIVPLQGVFEADVDFGGTLIPCNISELRYIEGDLLSKYFSGDAVLSASRAAQIAVDLLRIRLELSQRGLNHNDLHPENVIVERLQRSSWRAIALEPSIKAVAIDLGSVADDSKSDNTRLNDLHWIERHISRMVEQLTTHVDLISDLDYRVCAALETIAHELRPDPAHTRTPNPQDYIEKIETEFRRTAQPWRPWNTALQLKTLDASYNAQTLEPWHVPSLFVDPDDAWLAKITAPGPLVITGMRGCGKTMLLRSAQFHARAKAVEKEDNHETIKRLEGERYIGLFVSAQRLLEAKGTEEPDVSRLFARLLVGYALEATHAIAHLADIDDQQIVRLAHLELADCVRQNLTPAPELNEPLSITDLERALGILLVRLSRSDSTIALCVHPSTAFPALACVIRHSATIWGNARILFLLDDISTRYLTAGRVNELLSALIFQNQHCAFKMTSEAQTMHLNVSSPGENHPAQLGRDLDEFDLGAEVYKRLKPGKRDTGKHFVEDILQKRTSRYSKHLNITPSHVLGDRSLEEIARDIAGGSDLTQIYFGLTALTNVCVGDIGDIIALYEQIYAAGENKAFPIPPNVQSKAFRDMSANRFSVLARRKSRLKDFALGFAEASHDELVRSSKAKDRTRLRQYSSVYVRITAGDRKKQTDQIRELVDTGLFVFSRQSSAPRAKTRSENTVLQFKLTFRKIYGITNYIGLAESDRFELYGAALQEWLNHPDRGKSILRRNLGGDDPDNLVDPPPSLIDKAPRARNARRGTQRAAKHPVQLSLVDRFQKPATIDVPTLPIRLPTIAEITSQEIEGLQFETLIAGLGFEDRTVKSFSFVAKLVRPKLAAYLKYSNRGRAEEIIAVAKELTIERATIPYNANSGFPAYCGPTLIDITGIAKPALFAAVRTELLTNRTVWIAYTPAEKYFPKEEVLGSLLDAVSNQDHQALLNELHKVQAGESGEYSIQSLLESSSDETRGRALCAFSSPKHHRLLTLIDDRAFDEVVVITDSAATARSRVARIAAEIATQNQVKGNIRTCDASKPESVLAELGRIYGDLYLAKGANFEIGLTGNKLQAAAAAAFSAVAKVSQCWYVSPNKFNSKKFTSGSKATRFFRVDLTS